MLAAAEITKQLYICSLEAFRKWDQSKVLAARPTVIFNLSGADLEANGAAGARTCAGVPVVVWPFPENELMEYELARVKPRLDRMLDEMRAHIGGGGANIILCVCFDGRNKSALLAAAYLVRYCNMRAQDAIALVSQVYFTHEQREEERAWVKSANPDPALFTKKVERDNVRALTLISYCKLVRSYEPAGAK